MLLSRLHQTVAPLCLTLCLALGACTVQPLYSNNTAAQSGEQLNASLQSISIEPLRSRYGQEVYNHLIFMFNNGKGEPENPQYDLKLNVKVRVTTVASIQNPLDNEDQPTASNVTILSTYVLRERGTNEVIATGKRSAIASYDQGGQYFAADRARRNAEDRAAREMAEQLRLAIAQALVEPSKTVNPDNTPQLNRDVSISRRIQSPEARIEAAESR